MSGEKKRYEDEDLMIDEVEDSSLNLANVDAIMINENNDTVDYFIESMDLNKQQQEKSGLLDLVDSDDSEYDQEVDEYDENSEEEEDYGDEEYFGEEDDSDNDNSESEYEDADIDEGEKEQESAKFGDICENSIRHPLLSNHLFFKYICYFLDPDPCETNPCNSGKCIKLNGGYRCLCPPGTYGKRCHLCKLTI